MARSLTAGTVYYSTTSLLTAVPLTMSAWVKVTTLPNAVSKFLPFFGIWNSSSNIIFFGVIGNATASSCRFRAHTTEANYAANASAITTGQWYHLAASTTGTLGINLYVNGTKFTTLTGTNTLTSPATLYFGSMGSYAFTNSGAGNIAEATLWNVQVTDSEVAALATGIQSRRVRRNAIKGYWPFWGLAANELDYLGNGITLTGTGSPPFANHAPVTLWTPKPTIFLASAAAVIVLSPSTVPNGDVGVAYSQTFTATGGTGPYTFAKTAGTLPTALTLTTAGVLSGTPTATGTFNFTIQGTDSLSATGTQAYTIIVAAALTITTTTLPNGYTTVSYSETVVSSGGTGAVTFAKTAGTLPTGLTLSTAGVLSGTPTVTGTFNFTVTATDTLSNTANQAFTVVIYNVLAITTTTLPNGDVGASYNQTIASTGGTGGTTFSQTAGTLPTGLTLSSLGVLSGTPITTGTFAFTVQVTDNTSHTASQAYTGVTINAAVAITQPYLIGGDNGSAYLQTVTATGGSGTYTFTQPSGTLPTGLSLNSSTGVVSGTPTATGTFVFAVAATDTLGGAATQYYGVTINSAFSITTTTLPNGIANVLYRVQISARGGWQWPVPTITTNFLSPAIVGIQYAQTINTSGGTGALSFTMS